jgi:hypothetical protein
MIMTRGNVIPIEIEIGTEIEIRIGIEIVSKTEIETRGYAPHSDLHVILINLPAVRVVVACQPSSVSVKPMEGRVSTRVEEIHSVVQIDVTMMGSVHVLPRVNPVLWVMTFVVKD